MYADLLIRLTPNASRNEIISSAEGVLRVKVTTPPIEGKADQALVSMLAKKLGLRARQVRILRGSAGRTKLVRIEGIGKEEAMRRLLDQANLHAAEG